MIYKETNQLLLLKIIKQIESKFLQSEFIDWMDKNSNKDWEISYKKDYQMDPDEYEEIIKHPKLVHRLKRTNFSDKKLDVWVWK